MQHLALPTCFGKSGCVTNRAARPERRQLGNRLHRRQRRYSDENRIRGCRQISNTGKTGSPGQFCTFRINRPDRACKTDPLALADHFGSLAPTNDGDMARL